MNDQWRLPEDRLLERLSLLGILAPQAGAAADSEKNLLRSLGGRRLRRSGRRAGGLQDTILLAMLSLLLAWDVLRIVRWLLG